MTRSLYRYNVETGDCDGAIDVTEMREPEIVALEARMWCEVDEPWVVRDSIIDDTRIPRPPLQRAKKSPTSGSS